MGIILEGVTLGADVQSALWIRDIKSARSAKRCICPPGRDKEVAASVSPAESQSGQWRPQVPRHLENVNETSHCTDLIYDPVMASQWCPLSHGIKVATR